MDGGVSNQLPSEDIVPSLTGVVAHRGGTNRERGCLPQHIIMSHYCASGFIVNIYWVFVYLICVQLCFVSFALMMVTGWLPKCRQTIFRHEN